jgi:transposase
VQIDLDTLPDDPAILQQMLREVVAAAAHQHGALHAENEKLRLLIQRLLRQQFGRRSEQLIRPAGKVDSQGYARGC